MNAKPRKAIAPLNDSVCEALELCEQFDALSEYADKLRVLEEAKALLFNKIPQDARFAAFSNRNSDFYKTFLELRNIVKRNDVALLEERFDKLRRGSQSSTSSRPALSRIDTNFLPYPLSPQSGGAEIVQMPSQSKSRPLPQKPPLPNANGHTEGHSSSNGSVSSLPKPSFDSSSYELSPSIVRSKMAVSKVLLVDVRPHDQFERCHIECPLVVCFEPSLLKVGMSEQDLEDSLVIGGANEFDAFAKRDKVDMIVLYDKSSKAVSDSLYLSIVHKSLSLAGKHPYLLKGGLDAWQQVLPSLVSETKDLEIKLLRKALTDLPAHGMHSNFKSHRGTSPPIPPPKEALQPEPLPVYSSHSFSSSSTTSFVSPPKAPPHQHFPHQKMPSVPPASPIILHSAPSLPQSSPTSSQASPKIQFLDDSKPESRSRTVAADVDGYADSPYKSSMLSLRRPKLLLTSTRSSSISPSISPQAKESAKPPLTIIPSATAESMAYSEEHVPPHLLSTTGLKNMGNTCYMNCILQCLLGVPQLTAPFSDGTFVKYINFKSKLGYKGQFASVFANLVRAMTQNWGGCVAPIEVKNFAGELRPDSFAGYDQQDCQEFLTFILDGLHEDLNSNGDKPKEGELDPLAEEHREAMGIRIASAIEWERYLKGDTSLVVDLFQGQYLSRLQCMTCKRTSTTYNAFSSLSLPIAAPKLLGQQTTLKTCFDDFVKPEILDGDNAWLCPHCQKKRRTVKTLQISRLPLILVIHLKRFKRSSVHGVNKLETPVDYPLKNLDLTRYWPQSKQGEASAREAEMLSQIPPRGQFPPFIYDLRAVTLHHGSLKSGHYTAVVQKPGQGWLYFDDANVCPVKDQAAVSKQAYVLFYKRRM